MPKISDIILSKEKIKEKAEKLGFDKVNIALNIDPTKSPYTFVIETNIESGPELGGKLDDFKEFLKETFDNHGILVMVKASLERVTSSYRDKLAENNLKNHFSLDDPDLSKHFEKAKVKKHVLGSQIGELN
jgi:hypothetical protein